MKASDFLLELGTEELPPKRLLSLRNSFAAGLNSELDKAQVSHGEIESFATPRRLAVLIRDLAEAQPEQTIERRGPAITAAFDDSGKPTKAALGFASSCGVTVEQLERMETEKGSWLMFREIRPGESISALIGPIVERVARALPIERPMRWGSSRAEFVRPVHWVIMLYGKEILPATVFDIKAGNVTRGHRFMSRGEIPIGHPNEYTQALQQRYVVASFEQRRSIIESQLHDIEIAQSATVVAEPELLDEVTSLVEWPVSLCGSFDPAFLEVPEEVLISAMKSHQRYFHLVDDEGKLIPRFVTVANIESKSPEKVIEGNERVIVPRLADAAFFYRQDSKSSLESRLDTLKQVVFQSKLGSYYDKAKRIEALAGYIAASLSNDTSMAQRAGLLCKTDLVTDMVVEFPELQGIMGGYYARISGESDTVAVAISDHYLPVHSGGALPSTLEGQCVAIADKLDTLTGLFGIGQPPTGSRDPFALRRQAIGVLRICIECGLTLDIVELVERAASIHGQQFVTSPLVDYLFERLAVAYQDAGISIDTFNAVRGANRSTRVLTEFDRQVRAMQAFRQHDSAAALAAANKRVANILKQANQETLSDVSRELFEFSAESELFIELTRLTRDMPKIDDYAAKLSLLAELRPAIDKYFDDVLVMADDAEVRRNRLATLSAMRDLFLDVADVSLLQM